MTDKTDTYTVTIETDEEFTKADAQAIAERVQEEMSSEPGDSEDGENLGQYEGESGWLNDLGDEDDTTDDELIEALMGRVRVLEDRLHSAEQRLDELEPTDEEIAPLLGIDPTHERFEAEDVRRAVREPMAHNERQKRRRDGSQ